MTCGEGAHSEQSLAGVLKNVQGRGPGRITQLTARSALAPKVLGSNPTKRAFTLCQFGDLNEAKTFLCRGGVGALSTLLPLQAHCVEEGRLEESQGTEGLEEKAGRMGRCHGGITDDRMPFS